MEYPEPEFIGDRIITAILESFDFSDPDCSFPGAEESDTPYLWGPPLFIANPTIVMQIHTHDSFYFDRTSTVDGILDFIGNDVILEFSLDLDKFTYASGINNEETDYTVLRVNFKAF
eukprot:scpid110414/ scgid30890/ 